MSCRLREGECKCAPGYCIKFGSVDNRVKVPGHPEHKGYLRAFPREYKR